MKGNSRDTNGSNSFSLHKWKEIEKPYKCDSIQTTSDDESIVCRNVGI